MEKHHQSGGRFLREPSKPRRSLAPLWISLAVVLVVALGVGGFFLLRGGVGNAQLAQPETTVPPTTQPSTEAPTTEPPTEEETEPPTTEPPPVYRNPLNGELLDEPYTGRIFISTISNVPDALPHVSANQADIIFETFVNYSIIRCIGLYSNISQVEQIGSIRSTRLMFNDITQHYNAILFHAGGSSQVLRDVKERGIENFSVDTWDAVQAGISVRDEYRKRYIGLEHSLLALGPKMEEYAAAQGYSLEGDPDKDYLLRFNEDGTPADGETAEHITITITEKSNRKDTVLDYNPDTGRYVYSQYGKVMRDGITEEEETYRNILVMFAQISREGMYQVADFCAGGEGLFACGGKLIPIQWGCDSEDSPFWFKTMDGEDLELGVGNTYIAITEPDSKIVYE
ncbi:MAG: DUF3048 domain-containing protein [Faecousia sp.]